MTRHWAPYTLLWEWNTISFLHQEKAHKITFASEDMVWEWKDEELFNCRKNSLPFFPLKIAEAPEKEWLAKHEKVGRGKVIHAN